MIGQFVALVHYEYMLSVTFLFIFRIHLGQSITGWLIMKKTSLEQTNSMFLILQQGQKYNPGYLLNKNKSYRKHCNLSLCSHYVVFKNFKHIFKEFVLLWKVLCKYNIVSKRLLNFQFQINTHCFLCIHDLFQ